MEINPREKIYLDHAAATPVRPEILARIPELLEVFANPSSIHTGGVLAKSKISRARTKVSSVLFSLPDEITFTSGATESLNIAIQGVVKKVKHRVKVPHVVTSAIEHPSIRETLQALEKDGVEVTYLIPDKSGIVDPRDVEKALTDRTALVIFSYVNSEIGFVADISGYVKYLRKHRRNITGEKFPYFLLDATQATTCFDLNVQKLGADILIVDGAKIGALKGSGLLYVRRGVEIEPIIYGGGQEAGLRPGTQNVLAIDCLAEALSLAQAEVDTEHGRLRKLSEYFIESINREIPSAKMNGSRELRAPHIVSYCFPGVDAEWLVLALDAKGVAISRGSACKSAQGNESEVLKTISPDCAESSIRFSIGKNTRKEDLEKTVAILKGLLAK